MLTTFWSVWISAIILGSIIGCGVLIQYSRKTQVHSEETDETTGHEYDGIQELDNPLPRWWVMMFWGTIIFGLIYLALYPGLGNFPGLLKVDVNGESKPWTSTVQWEKEVEVMEAKTAPLFAKYAATPIPELAQDQEAMQSGLRIFKSYCLVCHGSNAKGSQGFPNLADNDWLFGGEPAQIKQTILNGRQGAMPAWGAVLGKEGTDNMVQYVRSLSGLEHDAAQAEAAVPQYQQLCLACHGADGKGNQLVGAPNLTDDVWLYGGSTKAIKFTIENGRNGLMPAHADFLGEDKVHVVAAYVYSLSQDKK